MVVRHADHGLRRRFNTPEGVEGFSRNAAEHRGVLKASPFSFNTPEGVEGFSSGVAPFGALKSAVTVSIPRRVLRGFRGYYERGVPARMRPDRFNTPEGVKGFSRLSAGSRN